jgi:hypothetical protein
LSTSPSVYTPPIEGTGYNATWYASAGYVNVDITGTSLIRAEDYAMLDTSHGWAAVPGHGPYQFTGSFDSAPDTGLTTSGVGIPVHTFSVPGYGTGGGESLLGSYNGGSFVIGAGSAVLTSFGFRIAAISNATFNVTINLFGSTNGSGTALETLTLNALSGGGNCQSLSQLTNGSPTPCNTAPFIYVTATGGVRSFSIVTSDPTGFYIDALDMNVAAPEPTTMLITGGGLVTLAWFLRRKRVAIAHK